MSVIHNVFASHFPFTVPTLSYWTGRTMMSGVQRSFHMAVLLIWSCLSEDSGMCSTDPVRWMHSQSKMTGSPLNSSPHSAVLTKASSPSRLDNWNANKWSKWSSSSTVSLFMYRTYARPVDFSNWSCKLLFVQAFPRVIVSLIWTITR